MYTHYNAVEIYDAYIIYRCLYIYIYIFIVYSARLLSDVDGIHTHTHTRKSISPFERLLTVVVVVVVGGVVNQSNKVPNYIYRLDASSCRRRIKHDRIVGIRTVLFFPPFFFLIYRYTFLASSLCNHRICRDGYLYYNVYINYILLYTHII
jgi:hypothetical protein